MAVEFSKLNHQNLAIGGLLTGGTILTGIAAKDALDNHKDPSNGGSTGETIALGGAGLAAAAAGGIGLYKGHKHGVDGGFGLLKKANYSFHRPLMLY